MSVTAELLSLKNPSFSHAVKRPSFRASKPSFSLKFQTLRPPRGLGFRPLDWRSSWNRLPIVPYAASREESKHSDIEVEKESSNANIGSEESQEAWKQTLETFKEQALKMQSVSQEAYEIYSKKAVVILKETSEQLKIQAEQASRDLSVLAKELSEEGKEYISTAAENSPEPVKEVVETFSSTDDLKEVSRVRDFHVGVPYGFFLSLGGFLSFMLTGSISAIRFGVIFGGALLALSVTSLRAYKRQQPYGLALKGQAVIAGILFLREVRLLSHGASFFTSLATIISGAVVAFYVYRIMVERKQSKGTDLGYGTKN